MLFNPRPAGGCLNTPLRFFRIVRKRRRAAPPNLVYLFVQPFYTLCYFFAFGSGQVRSPGQVKWPHLRKTFKLRHGHSSGDKDLKLSGFGILPSTYNLYISDFQYRWPKVRSISWPPHYESMGKNSSASNTYQICSNRSEPWSFRLMVTTPGPFLHMWHIERLFKVI